MLRNCSDSQAHLLLTELEPILHHPDPEIRCDVIELLLLIRPSATIDLVLPMLADPIDFVRNCVCQELEFNEFYSTKALEPLINSLLHDPFGDVRYRAALLLGEIGDDRPMQALEWTVANDKGENYEGDLIKARAEWALKELRRNT